MTAGSADALDHALELQARPGTLAQLRKRPLPDSVLLLIRIAAGDQQAMQLAAARSSALAENHGAVAVSYLHQVLFATDADHYRLLGVREDASDDALKEHYRWLMRWLHPDRDPDRGGESDAQRVNRAWHVLRSDERRRAYDRQRERHAARADGRVPAHSSHRHASAPRAAPRPPLSPRAVHILPALVLGGMALLAGGSLAAWHWLDVSGDANVVATQRAHRDDTRAPARAALAKASIAPVTAPALAKASIAPATLAASPVAPLEPVTNSRAHPDETKSAPVQPPPVVVASRAEPTSPQRVTDPEPALAKSAETVAPAATERTDADSPYAAVVDELTGAYAQGDLDRMMRLFDPNAFDDEHGMAKVADDYRRLFRQTGQRRLRLSELAWSSEDGRIVGTGAFDARIRRHGHSYAHHLRGRIVLELVPVDNQWKIHRLTLQKDGQ